jgi:hypothetical protein
MRSTIQSEQDATFQSGWYRGVILAAIAYHAAFWFVLGPGNPFYAVSVALTTFAMGPALPPVLMQWMPAAFFRCLPWERRLHRLLGVGLFARLLTASGWNRTVAEPMRGFTGRRADLRSLTVGVKANLTAHATCFAMHGLLAVLALSSNRPVTGALWMLLPALPIHLYPALVQRSLLARIEPLVAGRLTPRPERGVRPASPAD